MKRPPGIWILLSAGVLWLSLQDVYGIRATALIFGKSTTTTPAPVANVTDEITDTEVVTASNTETNNTKPNMTGIPQIDYRFDPNLPKELNGYNLSDYPFYERVPDPEEIDFKCDGLHDGFYASIPYKCQVYHHCLFGTRYDFLCANYTAFDQKTFICQFVSDVDCVGSKKFWHRNDALYQAATTTTQKPLNIYTPPPQPNPVLNPEKGGGRPRGGSKRKRPLQRRPVYDYYDYADDYDEDYYEDRPRSRRKRPRPRPRPLYDEEYDDDYEEDAYERRNRRPYNRRGGAERRKNKNRNKNRENNSEDHEERPKDRRKINEEEEDDYKPNNKRKPAREDKFEDERPKDKRKPARDDEDDRPNEKRKSQRGDNYDDERPSTKRKPFLDEDDKSENNRRKPSRTDNYDDDYDVRPSRPRKGSRRPAAEDDYDDLPRNEERGSNRPRKKIVDDLDNKSAENKPLVKPTTGTIYDRPRVAPRIKPPVPKNEADKYAYKTISKPSTASTIEDEEYYDDYEEDQPKSKSRRNEADTIKPKSSETKERKQATVSSRGRTKTTLDEEDDALTLSQQTKPKPETSRGKDRYRSRSQPKTTEASEVKEEIPPARKSNEKITPPRGNNKNSSTKKQPAESEYYDDEYEIEKTSEEPKISSTEAARKKWKPSTSTEMSSPRLTHRASTKSTTTTTVRSTVPTDSTEDYKERPEQIVRIVKRPFLPSRGGNPYSPRGLQPVGFKAAKPEVMEQDSSDDVKLNSKEIYSDQPSTFKPEDQQTYSQVSKSNRIKYKDEIIPSSTPQLAGGSKETNQDASYAKLKFSEPISDDDDDFKPIKRPQHILRPNYDENNFSGPRTTQKPKIPDRNPLDINENEYDVTLNDALNPTLPNLPVRPHFPTGFSPANDYTFSAFQRPRYVLEPVVSSANRDYVYQPKQPARQRFETGYPPRDQFPAQTNDYKNYYTVANGDNKRGVTQAHAQAFYSTSY